jgi:hypothetical protein
MNNKMETYAESFWATLQTSFPLFAREIGDCDLSATTSCVLGCSDGKFVIPLVRAGCRVTAVDIDPIMLFGGDVVDRGKSVHIRGLSRNLEIEGLLDHCAVIEADFMGWETDVTYDFVLTSGSWAYNRNLHHGLRGVVTRMQNLVAARGYLFADYLLPLTQQERSIDLYPKPETLQRFFPGERWRMVHNEDVGLIGEVHYPLTEWHYHRYGALLVQRLQ